MTLRGAIEIARAAIAEAAPDSDTAAEGEAYLMRQVAAVLNDNLLAHLSHENGLQHTRPTKGGPNPDYRMYHAVIDPAQSYRIEGWLECSERVGIGTYAFTASGEALLRSYRSFGPDDVAADGSFELNLGAEASGPGCMPIPPDGRALIIRVLHRDPAASPARLILRGGASPGLPGHCDVDAMDARAGAMLLKGICQFLQWTQLIGRTPNRFIAPPAVIAGSVQGDPDTFYRFASFDLGPGEALTAVISAQANTYWSLHCYTYWLELLPGAGVGDLNAAADARGECRITISGGPSNTPDRAINTQGRRRGMLIYRAIGSREEPLLSPA